MVQLIRRLRFWLSARNRHGTHSPFVYTFLEESLYDKKYRDLSPEQHLLLAAVDHFRPENAGAQVCPLSEWLAAVRPRLRWGDPPYDLFIFGQPGAELPDWLERSGNWHNDSLVFVGGIRDHSLATEYWRRSHAPAASRVVIETYSAGLLFFRQEQAREHFKIRL